MEKVYENMNKYGEEMKGKFSHKAQRDGIVISVTSPFVEEIYIESDENIHKAYWETYSLLPPQAEHPKGEHRKIYYNTREKYYYRSEWREKNPEQQESKSGYIWVMTEKEYIVQHARQCEELQAHYRSYRAIHKGQLCVFTGYAVDPNGNFKKPSTVESMFDRHKWFFNPWSFKVSLLDENTIDDFVQEVPIPKLTTDKIILDNIQEYQHTKTNGLNIDGLVAEIPPSKSATLEILQKYKSEEKQSQKEVSQQVWNNRKESLIQIKDWFIESKLIAGLITGLLTGGGGLLAILKWIIPFFQK